MKTMTPNDALAQLAERTIRDLTETAPEVMTVLAPLGIDLCCGGGRPLGTTLDMHGIERAPVLDQIARMIGVPPAVEG
jgi:iron-sulfur cluster repair protein YtfE (RIC family)